jgi:hypothetical protein
MTTSKALIQRERVSAKLLSVELEAVNFSFYVQLGVCALQNSLERPPPDVHFRISLHETPCEALLSKA